MAPKCDLSTLLLKYLSDLKKKLLEKKNSLQSFINQLLRGLFFERGRIVEQEDVTDNLANDKVSRLIKFMENRKGVIVYGAVDRVCVAHSMAQQNKQQHRYQHHPGDHKLEVI